MPQKGLNGPRLFSFILESNRMKYAKFPSILKNDRKPLFSSKKNHKIS